MKNSASISPKLQDPCILFLRDLDPDLRGQFKAACARRGRSMKGVVTAFMRDITLPSDRANERIVNLGKLLNKYPDPR